MEILGSIAIGAVSMMFGYAIAPYLWAGLRALRRLMLRRWLRLRLESYEVQDKEWGDEAPTCPQPTSPTQSAPTTGLTPGQSARLSANLAFHLRKQAQPENED